jgi:Pol polyprotein
MTDDLTLFRTPLTPISRRTILVGGGQLYARWKGTAEIQVKDCRSILISDVLYVPNLGANLLSSRKLCSKGLTFTGDNKTMAFWHNEVKVLEASEQGGVYILSWINPNLKDNAFNIIDHDSKGYYKDYYKSITPEICQHHDLEDHYKSENPENMDQTLYNKEDCMNDPIDYKSKNSKLKLENYRLWHEGLVLYSGVRPYGRNQSATPLYKHNNTITQLYQMHWSIKHKSFISRAVP